jgi:hypothetical protein
VPRDNHSVKYVSNLIKGYDQLQTTVIELEAELRKLRGELFERGRRMYHQSEQYEKVLRRLVEACDTYELADGSSIDTRDAHALLGDFDMKTAYVVSFSYGTGAYQRIVRCDNMREVHHHLEKIFPDAKVHRVEVATDQQSDILPPLSKMDANMVQEASERSAAWKPTKREPFA